MALFKWFRSFLLILAVALIGCVRQPDITNVELPDQSVPTIKVGSTGDIRTDEFTAQLVEVSYATNRNLVSQEGKDVQFGKERSRNVHYGSMLVSVPLDRAKGTIQKPWFFGQSPIEGRHFKIVSGIGFQNFGELAEKLKSDGSGKLLVFIHGYNVSFQEAAFRTAQIAHDVEFSGKPMFFSWPSASGILSYGGDGNSIRWSISYIATFLNSLINDVPDKDIYVIAHSMGSVGASEAIAKVVNNNPHAAGRIKELILASPDIDEDIFKDEIQPALSKMSLPTTVYTSNRDWALKLSQWWNENVRVGGLSQGSTSAEFIDATHGNVGLLGHSIYAESRLLMDDMHYLIEKRLRADGRAGLRRIETSDGPFWQLKK